MKILWLCNIEFTQEDIKGTGSWLQPLAEMINNTEEHKIINVTFGKVKGVEKISVKGIQQYIIPTKNILRFQKTSSWIKQTGNIVRKIENEVKPDLIHIWGTEQIWISLYREGYLKSKVFLDIQGLKFEIARYFLANLSREDLFNNSTLRDIVFPMYSWKGILKDFYRHGEEEKRCIRVFKHISVQSTWVQNQILSVNPTAHLYHTKIILRKPFYESKAWTWRESKVDPIIFTSSSGTNIYKGIHVLLQAISLLKRDYPNVELRVAGGFLNPGRLGLGGYDKYCLNLIEKLDIKENITLVGQLSANQIIDQLQQSDVCVVPSFIESYCLCLAEALIIGTPCVVSYSGAMPELVENGKDALLYNSADYATAAVQIKRLIEDKKLAEQLSNNARSHRFIENDPNIVLETQLDIYKKIFSNY